MPNFTKEDYNRFLDRIVTEDKVVFTGRVLVTVGRCIIFSFLLLYLGTTVLYYLIPNIDYGIHAVIYTAFEMLGLAIRVAGSILIHDSRKYSVDWK